mmetsp:Transcript_7107/g.28896  ORF Transcript_7107/g.28896 Transcript_7107/m.28896 type:complete len:270 (-) Transcript_7107:1282-2091(-)
MTSRIRGGVARRETVEEEVEAQGAQGQTRDGRWRPEGEEAEAGGEPRLRRGHHSVRPEPRAHREVQRDVRDGAQPVAQGQPRREGPREQGKPGGEVRGRRALRRDPALPAMRHWQAEGCLRVAGRARGSGRLDLPRELRREHRHPHQVLLHRSAGRGDAVAVARSARSRARAREARRAQGRVHRRRRVPARIRVLRGQGRRRRHQGHRHRARLPAPGGERQRGDRRAALGDQKRRRLGRSRDAAGAPRDVSAADRRGGRRRSPREASGQ